MTPVLRTPQKLLAPPTILLCGLILLAVGIHSDHGNLFHRSLIEYDDHFFVRPLRDLTITQYLTDYLWRRDVYTYPLRDLLFQIDFALERATGLSPFLCINILWFIAYLLILFKVAQHLLPTRWAIAFVACISLHPHTTQVVQWISARKHLMVATLGAYMTLLVCSEMRKGRWTTRALVIFVILEVCIALSYSSGVVLAVVGVGLLWAFNARREAVNTALISLGVGGVFTLFFALRNKDFHLATRSGIGALDWELAGAAIGRMWYNLLFPIMPSIYYREESILNPLGAALLFGCGYGFVRLAERLPKDLRCLPITLALCSVIVFAPHVFFLLNYHEFFAADRYMFIPFPYLLLAALLLLHHYLPALLHNKVVLATVLVILAGFATISARAVPLWRSGTTLFSHCAHVENAARCWMTLIQTDYNQGRCPNSSPNFGEARRSLLSLHHPERSTAFAELPLYEGLCAVTHEGSLASRKEDLSALEKTYGPTPGVAFSQTLYLLEAGLINDALLMFANATVGSIGQTFSYGHNMKTIEIYFGQARYLCREFPSIRETCDSLILPEITRLISNPTSPTIATGFDLTQSAHHKGVNTSTLQSSPE